MIRIYSDDSTYPCTERRTPTSVVCQTITQLQLNSS